MSMTVMKGIPQREPLGWSLLWILLPEGEPKRVSGVLEAIASLAPFRRTPDRPMG
jgi:hypothetical protein